MKHAPLLLFLSIIGLFLNSCNKPDEPTTVPPIATDYYIRCEIETDQHKIINFNTVVPNGAFEYLTKNILISGAMVGPGFSMNMNLTTNYSNLSDIQTGKYALFDSSATIHTLKFAYGFDSAFTSVGIPTNSSQFIEITEVKDADGGKIITGTFSGYLSKSLIVPEYTIRNGVFRVKIK